MGVRRTALEFEDHYTQIPNGWMRDVRLSRRARGVLAEIMTHRVGWHVSVSGLVRTGPEGRDAIRSALVELKDAGYLEVSQTRGAGGRWNEVEYELRDPSTANGKSVSGGFTGAGSTASGESATKNNSSREDHLEELLSPDESDDSRTLIPDEWRPNQRHIDKAASLRLDVKYEYQRFRAHAERTHRRMKSWNTGFTNWLRKSAEMNQQRGGGPVRQTFAQQRQSNSVALVAGLMEREQHEEVGSSPRARVLELGRGE